jgi:HK97 family phage major capsid protein
MNKEQILKRLKEINERAKAISTEMRAEGANVEALTGEVDKLSAEKRNLETQLKIIEIEEGGNGEMRSFGMFNFNSSQPQKRNFEEMTRDEILAAPEYRSAYLKDLQGKALTDDEKRALTTGTTSAGAAVPITTLNKVIEKLQQTSVLFSEITVSYVPGNLSLVVANAKNAASWKAEGADGTSADDTVVNVNLTGYELIKLVEISAAAQAMTIDAFEAYIATELGKQMAIAIEFAIIQGDGEGEPTGILNGVTFTAGANLVEWAAAGNVDYDTLVDGIAALPTMYHQGACFCMNRKMQGAVRKIKDDLKQPIFVYNPQDATKNAILGYRVIVNDYMPDNTILFCDHSYYYMNFSKAPEISSSREAGFRSGKLTYRGLAVADGKPALGEAFVKISKAQA